jgi:hypothetical protein
MATILKKMGLELLTDPWNGFDGLGVECFGVIIPTTFHLVQAKLPCNFGGWKNYADFVVDLQQFSTTIKSNAYARRRVQGFFKKLEQT